MRPIRALAPLALGLLDLTMAGCQRLSDPTTTAPPTRVERAASTTTPTGQATPPNRPPNQPLRPRHRTRGWRPSSAFSRQDPCPGQGTPGQRDAGHQPSSVSTIHAQAELDLFAPYVERLGPAACQVHSHHGEWKAMLYLAQPVRHDNGVWVVTGVGDPVGE